MLEMPKWSRIALGTHRTSLSVIFEKLSFGTLKIAKMSPDGHFCRNFCIEIRGLCVYILALGFDMISTGALDLKLFANRFGGSFRMFCPYF